LRLLDTEHRFDMSGWERAMGDGRAWKGEIGRVEGGKRSRRTDGERKR
jgi:hypothetical protein